MTDELWPTVPESHPPGLNDGTPPSGSFHLVEAPSSPSLDGLTVPPYRVWDSRFQQATNTNPEERAVLLYGDAATNARSTGSE